jgi:FkbH-like protein
MDATKEIKTGSDVRRVLLVGDTTLDPLGRHLERAQTEPRLQCTAAPYGQVFQILLDASNPVWSANPEILVVWTSANLSLPSFAKLLQFKFESASVQYDEALREAEQLADAIVKASSRVGLVLVPTWILPTYERWIQTLAWGHRIGVANFLARANLMLAEKFAEQKNIVLLDAGYWQASLARSAFDLRMFAVAKILYSNNLFEKAAAEMRAVIRGSLGQTKKVVVCDLDNTLWGGVVGDDGPQNIKLGAPDPLGECFQAFQSTLKGLRSRGILLTICSKNDEKLALSVIEEHPAMILRKGDFVGWRINWKDKAENLAALAEELNLGLDSFVFLDDSPQERDQIRHVLSQVYVPDLPASPSEFAPFLASLDCFETPSLGKEDLARTEMYRAERDRKEALNVGGDVENWLGSLQIKVSAAPLRPESLQRAAQLLNKTNQFNLTLRRLDEKSFWDWAESPANSIYTFNVSDRFGDFGLVCRVMGKKVEEALLGYAMERAKAAGAKHIVALPVDGPRNGPAKDFFASKFANDDRTEIDSTLVSIPAHISLKEEI